MVIIVLTSLNPVFKIVLHTKVYSNKDCYYLYEDKLDGVPSRSYDNVCFDVCQINDEYSSLVVAQLLFLQSEDALKPINMYINSPGKALIITPT